MQVTSDKGLAFLEAHEGVVLKAYRCPAGVWTIGAGLTAASGVVQPRAGMTIDRAEARQLLGRALARNYEPATRRALGQAKQHQFDGGVSFQFNTGAIARASWVQAFLARDWPEVRRRLAMWSKGGGRVLPGLVRRRAEEADVIIHNEWPSNLRIASDPPRLNPAWAALVVSVTPEEIAEIRAAFAEMGYDVGALPGRIAKPAVVGFQRDHDLTVDGLIGKATLSALQREIDARRRATGATGTGAAGTGVAGGGEALGADPIAVWIGAGAVVLAVLALLWLAYTYRDVIAVRLQDRAPRLAAWLRSF